MYSICTNKSPKIIIKHIKYKLNEEQYFDIEIEMERNAWRVVDMWMWDTPPPEGDGAWNIGRLVRWHNPLWMGRTIGTTSADSWAVILPDVNNESKIPAGIHSLSPSWIRFVRRTLTLTVKGAWRVVEPLLWDDPPPDGNIWVRQRWIMKKGLLRSIIFWEDGDRCMGE